jgi:cell wall-associated NlpC family hydrolase
METDSRTHLPDGIKTTPHHVTAPSADLLTDTGMGTQALSGQRFSLIESKEGRAYGALLSIVPKSQRIDYIGFLPQSVLSDEKFKPTHTVTAVIAAVFEAADIKSSLLGSLPRNAALEGTVKGDFFELPNGGYIHMRHLRSLRDPVEQPYHALALDMLNLPYIWGGTGQIGVDCSGLVQSALAATGIDAPRDADQQEVQLGQSVDFTARKSGDLLFWPGHVGIVVDGHRLLHANAYHMCVAIEPVMQAVERIGAVRTVKRL